jgi:uncharacterized protein (TIGR03067 family)
MCHRKNVVWVLLPCLLTGPFVADAKQTTKEMEDLKAMHGVWDGTSLFVEGNEQKLPRGAGLFQLTVTNGKATAELNGKPLKGTYSIRLDRSTKPHKIDLVSLDNVENIYGIYELKGDQLMLCILSGPDASCRPVDFTGKSGGLGCLFERKK